MHGETPGHVVSIAPTVSQETISITQGVPPRADQPNRPAGTGHSAEKSSPSAIGPPPIFDQKSVTAPARAAAVYSPTPLRGSTYRRATFLNTTKLASLGASAAS